MTDERGSTGDVVVVGSGIVGAAIVWRLAQDGRQVQWVTGPGVLGSASAAAGAMLAVYSEVSAHQDTETREVEVTTRARGRALWDAWLPAITVASGADVELTPGIHVVGRGPGDAASLGAIRSAAFAAGARCERVAPEDVPGLKPDRGWEPAEALFLPDEASLDGGRLLDALHAANRSHGCVTVVPERAVRVDRHGTVTTDAGSVLSASTVVLAVGIDCGELLLASGLGELMPNVFAGRGVSVLARSSEPIPGCVRTPNRSFACGLHLVPRADGLSYLGATNRFATQPNHDVAPTMAELDDLMSSGVRELDARLRRAEVVAMTVGHRPVVADRLPLVGRTAEPAIFLATATWRNGFVLAPLIAELIADDLTDAPEATKHPFAATRTVVALPLDRDAILRAAEGIADTLLGGAPLAAGRNADLVAFLQSALTTEVDAVDGDRAVGRLLERAPLEEALPLVFELLIRRHR